MLEIVYGETEQRQVASQLADVLTAMQLDGTFYIGYPVIASADEKVLVDALLLTKQHGLIAFRFSGESPRPDDHQAWTQLEDAQNRLFYAIDANLGRHDELRAGRKLGVTVETVTLFPTSPRPPAGLAGRFAGLDEVRDAVDACRPIEDAYLRPLEAALQRVTTIKPRKKRAAVTKTRGEECLRLRTPIRFDFDPSAAGTDHSASHVTLNDQTCRIPACGPLSLGQFIEFVFLRFYPAVWAENDFLAEIGSNPLPRQITGEHEQSMHLNWRGDSGRIAGEEVMA